MIQLTYDASGFVRLAADNDAVGVKRIVQRAPLSQKFRVRDDVKRLIEELAARYPIGYLAVRSDRNRALTTITLYSCMYSPICSDAR